MNFILTGIPSSGNRWIRSVLKVESKVPWKTPRGDIVRKIRGHGSVWGHIPAFPEVLDLPYYKVHIRRKCVQDQICSFASRPMRAIPPDYIPVVLCNDEMEWAMRVMAFWYPLNELWLEKADHVLYYEDLCEDFASAIKPIVDALDMNMGDVMKRRGIRSGYRLGCPGIGQHEKVWNEHYRALYEELFDG